MAELRAAVTDTHPLIFHAAAATPLSPKAARHFRACDRQEALTYVPVAVIWECGAPVRAARIDLGRPLREFFEDLFSNPGYQPVDLTPQQVYLADERRPNQDPFDGLICAAACDLGLPLITRDGGIEDSGLVAILW